MKVIDNRSEYKEIREIGFGEVVFLSTEDEKPKLNGVYI